LTKLFEALTGEQPDFVDETHGELKLREKLENRNCLLVIDDVWHKARLEPLSAAGVRFPFTACAIPTLCTAAQFLIGR
jgi:hypothetical protein